MIKTVGVMMIISSCSVMGMMLSREMKLREKSLKDHIAALHVIKAEILYKRSPLSDIMPLLYERCGQKAADFYKNTFDSALTGMSFSRAADRNYSSLKKDGLENQDIDVLRGVCSSLGRYDSASQAEAINKGIAQLENNLRVLKNELNSKGQLYKAIGAAAGAALALIII